MFLLFKGDLLLFGMLMYNVLRLDQNKSRVAIIFSYLLHNITVTRQYKTFYFRITDVVNIDHGGPKNLLQVIEQLGFLYFAFQVFFILVRTERNRRMVVLYNVQVYVERNY